jgi:hypothetical protein
VVTPTTFAAWLHKQGASPSTAASTARVSVTAVLTAKRSVLTSLSSNLTVAP